MTCLAHDVNQTDQTQGLARAVALKLQAYHHRLLSIHVVIKFGLTSRLVLSVETIKFEV